MRFLMILGGLAVISLGIAAMQVLEKTAAMGFPNDALTIGGAFIICAIFSLRMPWHAISGTAIIALFGLGKSISNITSLPKYLLGDRSSGPAPALESALAYICILLFIASIRALLNERSRRQHEELMNSEND